MAKTPANPDEMKWRAREAMDTIRRAEEHKADPELMKHVKKLHDDTAKAIEVVVKPAPRKRK